MVLYLQGINEQIKGDIKLLRNSSQKDKLLKHIHCCLIRKFSVEKYYLKESFENLQYKLKQITVIQQQLQVTFDAVNLNCDDQSNDRLLCKLLAMLFYPYFAFKHAKHVC